MSRNKTYFYLGLTAALIIAGLVFVPGLRGGDVRAQAQTCDVENSESQKIDCWYEVIRGAFDREGTGAAMDAFELIYESYDVFSDTGCHRHAHRVGDMSYYFDYLTHKDLAKTEFPPNTVACGYGFYHGFFEHLTQDNPDPAFVTETCEYLTERLLDIAPAISQTCYHGSGHGFILARADALVDPSQWSLAAFVDSPNVLCESLPKATEQEISECRQGVYNVIVDWMEDEEYGFVYDRERPFTICDTEAWEHQRDCYYEMAQKVDGISGHNPVKAVSIAREARRTDLQGMILAVAVAGMVQQNPKGSQEELLQACRAVTGDIFKQCLAGIVGGLIEHGTPGDGYQEAFTFCGQEGMLALERDSCYGSLAMRLHRFQSPEQIEAFCEDRTYPEALCSAASSL